MAKPKKTAGGAAPTKPAVLPVGHADVPLCQYDTGYEVVTMDRRELAPWAPNPRVLSDKAAKKLKAILAEGLAHPAAVFNLRNKTMVGGHQRLKLLDSLMKTSVYRLRVAVGDWSEQRHAELAIALNNHEATGDWNIEALHALFQRPEADRPRVEATGHDFGELFRMFGDSPFGEHDGGELLELAERIRNAKDRADTIAKRPAKSLDNSDFYTVLVHQGQVERDTFHELFGWDDNRFQDGKYFAEMYAEFCAWRTPQDGEAPPDAEAFAKSYRAFLAHELARAQKPAAA